MLVWRAAWLAPRLVLSSAGNMNRATRSRRTCDDSAKPHDRGNHTVRREASGARRAGHRPHMVTPRVHPKWQIPPCMSWLFHVAATVALAIAVVDHSHTPQENLGFRSRALVLSLALALLGRVTAAQQTRRASSPTTRPERSDQRPW